MKYVFDLPDFKIFLHEKNPKYRVDGLIFWQNRIPIPIDLFNRIFEDSSILLSEYIRQLTCAVIVFGEQESFEENFNFPVKELPSSKLKKSLLEIEEWFEVQISDKSKYKNLPVLISEILQVEVLTFDSSSMSKSLCHQGKKYCRLSFPKELYKLTEGFPSLNKVGTDNTDMIGNIIADRYDIYRSGFSDALAIIFNSLLEFRIFCSGTSENLGRIKLEVERNSNSNIKIQRTKDGSLWDASYEDDHCLILNNEHPFFKKLNQNNLQKVSEILYLLAEFENNQFSDSQRKLIEHMRQEVSRTLWIEND